MKRIVWGIVAVGLMLPQSAMQAQGGRDSNQGTVVSAEEIQTVVKTQEAAIARSRSLTWVR